MTEQQTTPKKRGRPPRHPGEGERPTLNFRCRSALRDRLQDAATLADRSLSEEIERRLDLSFRDPEIRATFVGNNNTADLLAMIAHVLKVCRDAEGNGWHESEEVNLIVRDAISLIVMAGCYVPTFAYEFRLDQETKTRIHKVARNVARSAAMLQMAIQDSMAVDSIADPADYMDQYNTPRRLRSEHLRALRSAALMYAWGARRAGLVPTASRTAPEPSLKQTEEALS